MSELALALKGEVWIMNMFVVVDMRSGMMDGMYPSLESAKEMAEFMESRYKGSFFRVLEMHDDGRESPWFFPPDHLMHWEMKKVFYKDREYVQ